VQIIELIMITVKHNNIYELFLLCWCFAILSS